MSRLGIEYLTSNQYTAFPFAEDAQGLARNAAPRHGLNATIPLAFLIDAVVYAPAQHTTIYLYSITLVEPNKWEFVLRDQDDAQVAVLKYTTDTNDIVGVQDGRVTVRFLKGVEFDSHLATILAADTYVNPVHPTLPFESVVAEPQCPRVDSFEIYQDLTTPCPTNPSEPITGHVRFLPGYNVGAAYSPDNTELDSNIFEWKAVAAAGEGQVPCDEQPPDDTPAPFMNLAPDSLGNVYFRAGDDCYNVSVVGPDTIQVGGDCYACCSCDDYLRVARAVAYLISRTDIVKHQLNDQRWVYYSPSLQDYLDRHLPQVRDLKVEVHGIVGLPPGAIHHAQIAVSLTNASLETVKDLTLEIEAESEGGGPLQCIGRGGTYTQVTPAGTREPGFVLWPNGELIDIPVGTGTGVIYRVKCNVGDSPKRIKKLTVKYRLGDDPNAALAVQVFENIKFERSDD